MLRNELNQAMGRNQPRSVLEVTYGCTSACRHCSVNAYLGNGAVMEYDTAKAAIRQAENLMMRYLLISGGESTLVRYLPNLVEFAKEHGMIVRVNTNGWKSNKGYG